MINNTVLRHTHIADEILIVDGLNGAGKSILGPVLGSLARVEKVRMEHIYEYLCVLSSMNKISSDAAVSLMNIYADLAIYNQMISREVNLRPSDDSGILNNPGALKYLRRLFHEDGDAVIDKIQKEHPILQLMTHQVLPVADLLFEAFGDRVKMVVMERHPVYLIEHWSNYIERFGTDPREFNLWLQAPGTEKGTAVPWFAAGWESEYLSLPPLDGVIHSLDHIIRRSQKTFDSFTEEIRSKILFISFEKFVTSPWPEILRLETCLKTQRTPATSKALKKQKCPRKQFTAGKGHARYGWQAPLEGLSDRDDHDQRYESVCRQITPSSKELLDALISLYEAKYDIWSDRG